MVLFPAPALPLVALALHGTSAGQKATHVWSGSAVWFALGVLLTGLLHLPFQSTQFSAFGCISGVALGASRALASISEDLIGTVAPPLSSCVAILSACAAGLFILDESFWSDSVAIGALSAMIVGVVGVCWAPLVGVYLDGSDERSPLIEPFLIGRTWEEASFATKGIGLLLAIASGLCDGLVLVPLLLAKRPWDALPALGAACFMVAIFAEALAAPFSRLAKWLGLHPDDRAALPLRSAFLACGSGCVWSLANVVALIAAMDLGYSRTYPIYHCHMVVVMGWQAVRGPVGGRSREVFLLSVLCLALGATMLFADAHT
jgi:glucose uptake protein GlcU